MISEALIINTVETMNTKDGFAIYQLCEKLGVPSNHATSNFIGSVLRKNNFFKEHDLVTIEPGKRSYLWFAKSYVDPRDKQIAELKKEIEQLKKKNAELEALQTDSYLSELRKEAEEDSKPYEPICEQLEGLSELSSEDLTEEELEALKLALSE